MLNRLAKNTTASLFIRQLMREMYTSEYCSSKTLRLIKQEHVMAIIGSKILNLVKLFTHIFILFARGDQKTILGLSW
jgi:hypothetical protein